MTFESPGARDSLKQMQSNQNPVDLDDLDIILAISLNPNAINTYNKHVGTLYQLSPNLEKELLEQALPILENHYGKDYHFVTQMRSMLRENLREKTRG